MKYKLVVCDMDGTLLNSNHSISDYTKKIISEIKEQDIKMIIATGRPYLDARYFRDHLNLQSYLITANGARAYDENDNIIVRENIDSKLVDEILSFEVDKDIYHRNLYVDDNWYVEHRIEGLAEFHKESGYSFQIIDFNKFESDDNVAKAFYLGEIDKIDILEKRLRDRFKDNLTVITSSPYCLEIMKKGVSKGKALEKIINKLGISLDEVIAFGDGRNDYEMLSMVGKGFLMGNATERLKEKMPNNEIIDTCNNDGVAKKLKEIFL